jgi:hypothetical protein
LRRAPLRLGMRLVVAAACGLTVAIVSGMVAGGSCTGPDLPTFDSTCSELVASLSVRLGVVVGVVVLIVGLVGTGVLRAAEEREARREHDDRGER